MDKLKLLLNSINKAQSQFIDEVSPYELFNNILEQLLLITDSEYGFIGEVLYKNGDPYLKTYALTNISWNSETREFYEKNAPTGLEFYNLNTLFGAVLSTKEVVISNNPSTDKRAGGIPAGHPDLNAFLGVPVFAGEEFLGMFGIANKQDGYDLEDVEFLKPLLATSAQLIRGYRINNLRIQAQQ
jgi:GAF domain-containing protein